MSHGIESPKAENAVANVNILVSTEAPRSSRATAPREIGSGRQRDRVRFERRGLGFEGEEREPESEREEKRKNEGRGERREKKKMKGEEREKEYKTIKNFAIFVRTVANLQRYCSYVV